MRRHGKPCKVLSELPVRKLSCQGHWQQGASHRSNGRDAGAGRRHGLVIGRSRPCSPTCRSTSHRHVDPDIDDRARLGRARLPAGVLPEAALEDPLEQMQRIDADDVRAEIANEKRAA
jgi:hypothetical protein